MWGLPSSPGGGGGTPIYGLYRYMPWNRVWFLRFLILKWGIFFHPFVTVFLVWSFDRVAKLYYLIPRSHQSLNMSKRFKIVFFIKAAY